MSQPLQLLGTSCCHLCEEALLIVQDALAVQQGSGAVLEQSDIALDEALLAAYGTRIPVLRQGQKELAWPFSRLDVLRWLVQG